MNENIQKILIAEMQNQYDYWLKNGLALGINDLEGFNDAIENKLIEIANEFGYELITKTQLLLVFENESDFLIGWHNDHDRSWGINETGFDFQTIDALIIEDLISVNEANEIMMKIAENNREFLTDNELEVIRKKYDENYGESDEENDLEHGFETLTNAERQTLKRIRDKINTARKNVLKFNFYSKFQI